MSFDVGTVVSEAWNRFATVAGALVFVALGAVGLLQTVAMQDLLRAFLEAIRDPVMEIVREENPDQAQEIAQAFDDALADIPLSLGLSPGLALLLWFAGFVLAAAVTVIGIDAFANDRDTVSGIEVDGFGRKTAHLVLGGVVIGLAVFAGFFVFVFGAVVVGLFVVLFLPYFPAAVVVDDEGFWGAFKRSVGVARENLRDTALVVLIAIGVSIGLSFVSGAVTAPLAAEAGLVVGQFVGTIATVYLIALFTRAYLAAEHQSTAEEVGGEADGDVHEEW